MREWGAGWFVEALKKYAVFGGRSRRREYWCFALFSIVIGVVLASVGIGTFSTAASIGLLSAIFNLVILVPSIAASVRRLHDTDRSGWWVLVSFVLLIGAIALLVFAAQDGTPGSNRYGPNPKTAV